MQMRANAQSMENRRTEKSWLPDDNTEIDLQASLSSLNIAF